ncbi:putative holin [Variovorax sp. E3]|uniref:putative holin n=1 Tax=Variovorax sp. E3 TaxID=1914993 RepID=UPI0027DC1D6E|nr:putative holin [Variovorax sp. E3]
MIAVTVYKAHLLSLGGWVGYWLDRALFPYDRPHTYLIEDDPLEAEPCEVEGVHGLAMGTLSVAGSNFGTAMLRRAIIVAAALICVGLGA